jgi:PAS domain S-box-containing protein
MNEFLRSFITSSQSYDSTTVELQIDHDLRHYIIAVQKYDEGNAIVVVGIDITEQKHVEKALSIAEENYRSIFENSLEGIFQSTLQGQYIRVNPALAKIYGYDSPEDMITTISNIGEQIYVDLEERQAFIRCLDQQDTVKGVEYRCYKKDGSIIWVQVDARVVRDQSGQIAYYEGTVQDITDRKKREAELQQQITNLKIEIDHQKREEEVLNLTATSYFQQVKQEIEEIDLDEFWS